MNNLTILHDSSFLSIEQSKPGKFLMAMLESMSKKNKNTNKNNYTTLRIIRAIKCPFSPYYLHAA